MTTDGLSSRAGHASELAEKNAAEADRTGHLSTDVIDALAADGFPRHFVPGRFGGSDGTFTDLVGALVAVGRSCASTAWCGSLFAINSRFATHLPVPGQEELWGNGNADTLIASGLVPSGQAEPADGGYVLSGRWAYVSGGEFADWALLAGPQQGPPANEASMEPRFFAVPKSAFTIEETWNSVGMRATASHTVVVDRVVVPEHRTMPLSEVHGGINHTSDRVQHNVPLAAVGGLGFVAPALGVAQGALSACRSTLAGKRPGPPGSAMVSRDLPLAHAAADIDAAALLVERVAGVLDAGEGRQFAVRNARDASYAAQLLSNAVTDLMRAAGTAAQNQSSPLQRNWRDITVATSHAALRFDRPASAFTEALLAA